MVDTFKNPTEDGIAAVDPKAGVVNVNDGLALPQPSELHAATVISYTVEAVNEDKA